MKPSMKFAPGGPILVRNLEKLTDHDGREIPTKENMALCRCGASKNKPFCDGTHSKIGFSDERVTDGSADRRVDYAGKKITIHDNRGICAHAGACTDGLPSVWRMKQEPWIDPDGAAVGEIIAVIERCPSGALSYTIDGVEHRDRDRPCAVRCSKDGPLEVTGAPDLEGVDRGEGASTEHFTLCRCGASKNKPFCDGSHGHVGFKGDLAP